MFVFFLPTLNHSGFSQSANVYLWGFYAIVCIWFTRERMMMTAVDCYSSHTRSLCKMEPVTQAEDSAFHLELKPLMAGQQASPTTASLTPRTCCRERSLLIFMYKQVPVLILFHHINIHDTSEWEMHNCNHSTACLTPKEHYIHITHLYSLPTQLYKCPKPFSSISHIEV